MPRLRQPPMALTLTGTLTPMHQIMSQPHGRAREADYPGEVH